jgi:FKBP-type peptidyl-prolyl cis-trans isomerase
MIRRRGWVATLAVLALAACGDGDAEAAPDYSATLENRDTAPTVDVATMTEHASGFHYEDMVVGSGDEAVPGQPVTVHYIGWFLDGEKFDASVDRSESFSFMLGAGGVIEGWDQGVAGMRVGGKRRLVLPPAMAYGEAGRSGIPPNSTLVFDVELFRVGAG